jgi:hypothetical protein
MSELSKRMIPSVVSQLLKASAQMLILCPAPLASRLSVEEQRRGGEANSWVPFASVSLVPTS